jgi:hypothetical protein
MTKEEREHIVRIYEEAMRTIGEERLDDAETLRAELRRHTTVPSLSSLPRRPQSCARAHLPRRPPRRRSSWLPAL